MTGLNQPVTSGLFASCWFRTEYDSFLTNESCGQGCWGLLDKSLLPDIKAERPGKNAFLLLSCRVCVCVLRGRMKLWMGDYVSWNFSSHDLPMKKKSRLVQQWPQGWKRSVFIPIPKKSNAKQCSNYHTIALISHASKVMLKVLQARLQ